MNKVLNNNNKTKVCNNKYIVITDVDKIELKVWSENRMIDPQRAPWC
jgi:hypothetical protein